MNQDIDPEIIGRRFHRPAAPTEILCAQLRQPIAFSHVVSEAAMPAPTLAPPVEDSFALHVHHSALTRGDIWVSGKHRPLPPVRAGGVFIWDLRAEPTAQLHEGFEFSRFHLPRAAMDDLAYEHGLRPPGELRAETCDPDPVLRYLALALLHRQTRIGEDRDSLFRDGIALALFDHVAQTYGRCGAPSPAGALPPWQVRQLDDWIEAHLRDPVSVADLARLLDLSPSYFSRAFVKATGMSPHQWILRRRVELAKRLLLNPATPLSDVAASCGFVDQSHFTNVFARVVRLTPGKWRRQAK